MTSREVAIRALVTFIAGVVAAFPAAVVFGTPLLIGLATAGLTAVVNYVGRRCQAWLKAHPEPEV